VTAITTHREVERKLRVHGMFDLPDLAELGVAASIVTDEPFTLDAVYHDTSSLSLFRWGITLRRRVGGHDEGWHMKLPVKGMDGSARDEIRLPLDAGPVGSVPGAFVEVIAPLLREQPLVPLVTLSTRRTPSHLFDSDGVERVELVDDLVSVLRDGTVVSVFRELEIECLDAEDDQALLMLERAVATLVEVGAEPSSVSKAASALGPRTQEPSDVPPVPLPGPGGLAVDAIRSVLALHVRHLLMSDVAVRRELPDSVHQMRVSARRIRSALATFAPLLDAETAATIREELKWLASELGAVRDTEVMIERLDAHAEALDDSQAGERARAILDLVLTQRLASARSSAIAALRSDRHQLLVDDLMTLAIDPPVTDEAFGECDIVLLPLVDRTWRRLNKSINGLELDGPSVTWHEARIKAKRARYAAESVADIFGSKMVALAGDLALVTDLLGDHQDAHVAQSIIREVAGHQDVDGLTGLSLGLLHEYETDEEIRDRLRFTELWPRVRRTARKAGLG
jgi:CHAD domain-containing protein